MIKCDKEKMIIDKIVDLFDDAGKDESNTLVLDARKVRLQMFKYYYTKDFQLY